MKYNHFLNILIITLVTGVVFSCDKERGSSFSQIENLKCENQNNPIGIDELHPKLSWQFKSKEKHGEFQTAYRILVATSPDKLHEGKADLWDSDKIKTNQSIHIKYNGKILKSRELCYWKVMVWDENDNPSAWSQQAFWSIGLTEKKDWAAQWIGSPDSVTSPYYRHSFQIEDVPEHAFIYIASKGYYEFYINGKKIGKEVLAPAVSNYNKRVYFKAYDVATYLKKGKNSLAIWMGTGWYTPGLPGVKHNSPAIRAQLEIPNKQKIVTDTSWETKASNRSRIGNWKWGSFGGEHVDARLLDNYWMYNDSSKNGWKQVVYIEKDDVPCTAQKCQNNIQILEIEPVIIERLSNKIILVDFGTNLTGFFKIKFNNLESGQKITMHYADLDGRDPDEAWRLRMEYENFSTYNQKDEFISAGKKEERFKNIFNYHGFRYVLIDGLHYIPNKEDLSAIPVETKVAEVGSFECSNNLYNQIHKMTRWTYRAVNLGGQTVDCPHRERVGYGADGQTIIDVGCYNFDAYNLYAKWSENWWDEQAEDGFVPFVAPTPYKTGGGPAWGAMSIIAPWKTYLFYGDRYLLEKGYVHMKKHIEYLRKYCQDGILLDIFPGEKWHNLGDWVPPGRGLDKKHWVDDNSRQFFNNCYRLYLLQIMLKISSIINEPDDLEIFKQELESSQKAIHEKWFNPEDSTYANGEQLYLIFPLKTEITPGELRNNVFEKYLNTLLVKDNGHLNTGMLGTQIMFDYLMDNNRHDLIDVMVNKKTFPGWGYMIEKGATTCWEQWNGYYSQIHSCFPYIDSWFYRGLGGIQWDVENPGFKNIILRPALVESVEWVKCSYQSNYGEIKSNWEITKDQFKWNITIPINCTAKVFIPGKEIRVNGYKVSEMKSIVFLYQESNLSVFKVESGDYIFNSEMFN